jgi:AraC family transcriptional regulator of adaptative response / DNA-3-methyladenine glycosylase II
VKRRPGLRIPGAFDPFECAVRAILGQQVSVGAARTFAARLVSRVGRPIAGGLDDLTHVFPGPAALADGDLDGLGLTRARVGALRALARATAAGTLDFAAPAAEAAATLAALPGCGAWTAQYVALRALGEPDAFPAADLVLRRMAAGGGPPVTPRALEARAEAWRPWRGYAALHLWRAASEAVIATSASTMR